MDILRLLGAGVWRGASAVTSTILVGGDSIEMVVIDNDRFDDTSEQSERRCVIAMPAVGTAATGVTKDKGERAE